MSRKNAKLIDIVNQDDDYEGTPIMQQAAWVGMIFVIGSISFTTYMVVMGTDNIVCQFFTIPQTLFALAVAIYKFTR